MDDEFSDTSTDTSSDSGSDMSSDVSTDTGSEVEDTSTDTSADEPLDTGDSSSDDAGDDSIDDSSEDVEDEGIDDSSDDAEDDGIDDSSDDAEDEGIDDSSDDAEDDSLEDDTDEGEEVEDDTDEGEQEDIEDDTDNENEEQDDEDEPEDEQPDEQDENNDEQNDEENDDEQPEDQDENSDEQNDTEDTNSDNGGTARNQEINEEDKPLFNDEQQEQPDMQKSQDVMRKEQPEIGKPQASMGATTRDLNANTAEMSDRGQQSQKQSFGDRIKGFFGGKKKNTSDTPVESNDTPPKIEGKDPHNDFIGNLKEGVNTDPTKYTEWEPTPVKPDENPRMPKGYGYSDDPRWQDAMGDDKSKNENNIEDDKIKEQNAPIFNDDKYTPIENGPEFQDAPLVNETPKEPDNKYEPIENGPEFQDANDRVAQKNKELPEIQKDINYFIAREGVIDNIDNKEAFLDKLRRPLSETVENKNNEDFKKSCKEAFNKDYSDNIVAYNDGKKSYINVDAQDDKGIKRNVIHENEHQLSSNDEYGPDNKITKTKRGISINGANTQVNEGITEYYTRKAMGDEYPAGTSAYENNADRVERLENIMGADNMQRAYYNNKPELISDVFKKYFGNEYGEDYWNSFSRACDSSVNSDLTDKQRKIANEKANLILEELEERYNAEQKQKVLTKVR